MRPDPGRQIQEALIASMSAVERTHLMARLRDNGRWLVWQQVDAAGIGDPVEQADFILRRLYPEMPGAWFEDVVGQLRARHAAGRWSGFRRPDR